jgi:hypothetical protein
MKPEHFAEDGEVVLGRVLEVKPEGDAGREPPLDLRAVRGGDRALVGGDLRQV